MSYQRWIVFLFTFLINVLALNLAKSKPAEVHALYETLPAKVQSDVMDDPVIWINQYSPPQSLILATRKREPEAGLYIYDLKGKFIGSLQVGPLNNVDVRANFPHKRRHIDIAVASHTKHKRLAFFSINPQSGNTQFISYSLNAFDQKPYGLCLSKQGDHFYAIVTFAKGGAEKWQFWSEGGEILTKKVKTYPIKTQAEGCAVDDLEDRLFLAEEDKAIWAFKEGQPAEIVAKVGEHELEDDLEGLTLYDNKYLIVSSQGNSTYGVFSAHPPYTYLGNFAITPSDSHEGTEETDGIDATAVNLGGPFTEGLFVAHDNRSSKGGGSNFKLVPWAEIQKKLQLQ